MYFISHVCLSKRKAIDCILLLFFEAVQLSKNCHAKQLLYYKKLKFDINDPELQEVIRAY